jgi:ABC-type nitrate/sulfonate/bicarbonate transport system permease component
LDGRRGWATAALAGAGVVVLWQAATTVRHVPGWLLPSPARIARSLVADRGLLAGNAVVTLTEAVLGFGLSVVLALGLAVAMRFSRALERTLWPLLVASQTVPIPAIAPLLVLWLGYGEAPKVVVVVLICFFPVVVTAMDGLRAADPDTLDAFRTLGAGRGRLFWLVEAPQALPAVFSGVKTAAAYAVIGAVFGEWLGGDRGLGVVMVQAAAQLLTARVFAALVWLAALGVALFGAVAGLERLLLPWHHTERRRMQWER